MNLKALVVLVIIVAVGGFGYFLYSSNKQVKSIQNPLPSAAPTQTVEATTSPTRVVSATSSPTPYSDTKSAIAAFLAKKYNKPVSEVHITVSKEVPGFASGSVTFGEGGPGEGGMWLAVLGNGWSVVWDGNGTVDCNKMRSEYGFPDTILKPNFCD